MDVINSIKAGVLTLIAQKWRISWYSLLSSLHVSFLCSPTVTVSVYFMHLQFVRTWTWTNQKPLLSLSTGIVPPKGKILSFTHPQVILLPYCVLLIQFNFIWVSFILDTVQLSTESMGYRKTENYEIYKIRSNYFKSCNLVIPTVKITICMFSSNEDLSSN